MTASAAGGQGARSYGAGARILSIGLALTGVVTLAFFALASHALDDEVAYGRVSLLWAITFMVTSVIYRPIEQLLARSIAESRARGNATHALRTPLILQAAAAVAFVITALLLRDAIVDELFGGEEVLFWVLVGAVSTYSLSYFARGWLAGSGRPELYGVLVFIESSARCLFPIVALIGLTEGTLAVALGIAAAPLISLAVVPLALRGGVAAPVDGSPEQWDRAPGEADFQVIEAEAGSPATGPENLTLRAGAVFAGSTVLVMLAEQILITAGVIAIALDAPSGSAVAALAAATGAAGAVFNAFLVSRAPLQLFQAVQSTLLPHLAALSTSGDRAAAAKALRTTMLVIVGFAGTVTVGLLLLGPWGINLVFEPDWPYAAGTLALIGIGMGLHLAGGTLNQSALAHGRAPIAAAVWACAAIVYVVWLVAKPVDEPVARAASGYVVAAGLLFVGLLAVERRSLRG